VLFSFIIVLISLRILWQPSHQRQKLIGAIKKYDVLRFVAGYPLPPDLNSNAASVREAIGALGKNVPLASFNLDEFRANFKSEDEAKNVLSPMEDALKHKMEDGALKSKRKAGQMDD
jgi:hypothetical protein